MWKHCKILLFYSAGFNRYMVECEYEWYITRTDAWWGFNRYMVECEYKNLSSETKNVAKF